jgi:DNA-binding NtrC family response regulator
MDGTVPGPGESIPMVEHFRVQLNERYGFSVRGATREALRRLEQYSWRGNVREVEALVEQAMIFRRGDWILPEDLGLPARCGNGVVGSWADLERSDTPVCGGDAQLAAARGAADRVGGEESPAARPGHAMRDDPGSRVG